MDNFFVLAFVFWPVVVLLCAGINMLATRTFSWSELVFDYVIGLLMGERRRDTTPSGASVNEVKLVGTGPV